MGWKHPTIEVNMKKLLVLMMCSSNVLACTMYKGSCESEEFIRMDKQYEIQDMCELSYYQTIVPLTVMARKESWSATEDWALKLNSKKTFKEFMPVIKASIAPKGKVLSMASVADNWWRTCNKRIDDIVKIWG